ncbi:hypothetical protein AMECASPLE_038925, partial [Ameca splendens]
RELGILCLIGRQSPQRNFICTQCTKTSSSKFPLIPYLQLLQAIFIEIHNMGVYVKCLTNLMNPFHLHTSSGTLNSNVKATWQDSRYNNSFQLDCFYLGYMLASTITSPLVFPHSKNFSLSILVPGQALHAARSDCFLMPRTINTEFAFTYGKTNSNPFNIPTKF